MTDDILTGRSHALDGLADLLHLLRDLLDDLDDATERLAHRHDLLGTDLDLLAALLHPGYGILRILTRRSDEFRDLVRGLLTRLGQLAHLLGDNREAAALLTGTCSLDGGVQCQQVRLVGDTRDRIDDFADLLRTLTECRDHLRGFRRGLLDVLDLHDGLVEDLAAIAGDIGGLLAMCCRIAGGLRRRLNRIVQLGDRMLRALDGLQLLRRALRHIHDAVRDLVRRLGGLVCRCIELLRGRREGLAAVVDLLDGLRDALPHIDHRMGQLPQLVIRRDLIRTIAQVVLCHEVHLRHHERQWLHDAVHDEEHRDGDEYDEHE